MDINVYLPDEIGARAKEADLNLSRLLRAAVTDELERRDEMAKTLAEAKTHELDLEDEEGRHYIGRITATRIARDVLMMVEVFLTDDERVIVYDGDKGKYFELNDVPRASIVEQLREWLPENAEYAAALYALGEKPVVDL